jgi:hypothetical protein
MPSVHTLDVEAELSVLDALTAPTISIPNKHNLQVNSEMDGLCLHQSSLPDPTYQETTTLKTFPDGTR